jgi:ribose transport system substrate-binding protein
MKRGVAPFRSTLEGGFIMKRILIVFLILLVSFSAFAKGFFLATLDSSDNSWRTQMRNNMQAVIDEAKAKGLISKYVVYSANNDATLQSQQLDQLVNQGVNAVFINPVSSTGLNPIIDKAVKKGIIVMGIDQTISHPKAYNYTNDQRAWARYHVEYIVKVLGGKGTLIRMDGIAGAPASDERAGVWDEVLKANPGIKVLKQVNHDWDQAKAKQLMSQIIVAFPKFDAILSQECVPGIYEALMDAKHKMPKVMTNDESVEGVQIWYEHNKKYPKDPINAIIVENPPGVGASGMQIALWMLQGKKLKEGVLHQPFNVLLYNPTLIITPANLEEWYTKLKDHPRTEVLDSYITSQQALDLYFQK